MPETATVIAGRCPTVFEGTCEQEQHGDVIVLTNYECTGGTRRLPRDGFTGELLVGRP